MAGFKDTIANALGQLVISALMSPNFVAGTSGWIIRKDGTVEFSSGVFRGTITNAGIFIYNGAPANGNLIVAIASGVGFDSFGNKYGLGFSMPYGTVTGTFINWLINRPSGGPPGTQFSTPAITDSVSGSVETLAIVGPSINATPNAGSEIALISDMSVPASTIKLIADNLALGANSTPFTHKEFGTSTLSFTASASSTATTVNFGTAFASVPSAILLTSFAGTGGRPIAASYFSVTVNGFSVNGRVVDGTAITGNIPFTWEATL